MTRKLFSNTFFKIIYYQQMFELYVHLIDMYTQVK